MRNSAIIIMSFLIIFTTGCWDKVELDRRTFVLGAAIDAANKKSSDEYMLTIETPVTKIINSTVGGGGKDQEKTTSVESDMGVSVFDIIRNFATETDKVLYWGHQQVLIIGEEVAKEKNIRNTIDLWIRDPEIIRSMNVFIAQGNGKNILEATPKHSTSTSIAIRNQIAEQVNKTSDFIDINLMKFISLLINNKGDALIGRIALTAKNRIEIAGSGVIKSGKLNGWLSKEETLIANLIMNEVKGGKFLVNTDENIVSLDIIKGKSKLTAFIYNKEPTFKIDIKLTCAVGDEAKKKIITQKYINVIEESGKKAIENQVSNLIKKIQKQYKADVFEFGNYLYKHHNKEWKQIEKEWNKIFPDVPVEVNVDLTINHPGLFYEE